MNPMTKWQWAQQVQDEQEPDNAATIDAGNKAIGGLLQISLVAGIIGYIVYKLWIWAAMLADGWTSAVSAVTGFLRLS